LEELLLNLKCRNEVMLRVENKISSREMDHFINFATTDTLTTRAIMSSARATKAIERYHNRETDPTLRVLSQEMLTLFV
jgi:hypothetical protein